jgi:KaiC/GvpD/RAD55 family RecA-like ATPase
MWLMKEEVHALSSKFGLPVLDDAIGGGIPRGHLVLLEEETGLSSDVLVSLFVAGGLTSEENVFVLNTDYTASTIRDILSGQGIDVTGFENSGRLAFINAFGAEEPLAEKAYAVIHNIADIREIHNVVKNYSERMQPPTKYRGVIDSLSTIILSSGDARSAFNFVRNQVISLKKSGGIVLMTVHKKAHSNRLIASLEHVVDGVIELRKEQYYRDWRSIFQIKKMIGRRFSTREFAFVVHEGKFVVE